MDGHITLAVDAGEFNDGIPCVECGGGRATSNLTLCDMTKASEKGKTTGLQVQSQSREVLCYWAQADPLGVLVGSLLRRVPNAMQERGGQAKM